MRLRRGFTPIELLVVLGIIGLPVGLLLSVVQSTREAARRAQCVSDLKRLALAAHGYHDAMGSSSGCLYQPQTYAVGRRAWSNVSWLLMLRRLEQQALHNAVNFVVTWGSTPVTPVMSPGCAPVYYGEQNATVRTTVVDVFGRPSDSSPRESTRHADEVMGLAAVGASYVGNVGSNRLGRSLEGSKVSDSQVLEGLSNNKVSSWNAWVRANQPLGSSALPLNSTHKPATTLWVWTYSFRSEHLGGASFAMCDGSPAVSSATRSPSPCTSRSARGTSGSRYRLMPSGAIGWAVGRASGSSEASWPFDRPWREARVARASERPDRRGVDAPRRPVRPRPA